MTVLGNKKHLMESRIMVSVPGSVLSDEAARQFGDCV